MMAQTMQAGMTKEQMAEVAALLRRVVPRGEYEEHLVALFIAMYLR